MDNGSICKVSCSGFGETLKKMFEVSGSVESYKTVVTQMLGMFKQEEPDIPEEIWNDLEGEFLKTSIQDLVDMLIPVYQKHLTKEDLDKIIEFYQTPVGKNFASKTPIIMQESMQIGQQWGMKIGQKIQEKMKEKGY